MAAENLLLMSSAFGLGVAHALEPGHGKAFVTLYLAGRQGRLQDALLLGGVVALTHLVSVVVLAVAAGWALSRLAQGLSPEGEAVHRFSDVVSGGVILLVGLMTVLRQRPAQQGHVSGKPCATCVHAAENPEGTRLKDLLLLGMAGGICPSPLPLVLLASALAIGGRMSGLTEAIGYLLLFTVGLSSVVILAGIALVLARQYSVKMPLLQWGVNPVVFNRCCALLMAILGAFLVFRGLGWGTA